MNRQYSNAHYTTVPVSDLEKGFSGLDLVRTSKGKEDRVATLIFWDASGQFFLETLGTDLPLVIVEELIAEAKTIVDVS